MKPADKNQNTIKVSNNPIIQMIEDKKKIVKALKNGKKLSSIKGIHFVSNL